MMVELEKGREIFDAAIGVTRIRESGSWIPQFIKEWVNHCLDRRQPLSWGILEQLGNKVDCAWVGLSEDLYAVSNSIVFGEIFECVPC